ncbi:MAG TPA: hypothetical protein VGR45_18945 [Stellaceae bacterium]|nr:hypothetical protein [Stellaceae bacterium]
MPQSDDTAVPPIRSGYRLTITLSTPIPLETKYGALTARYFRIGDNREGVVLSGSAPLSDPVFLRLQSSCLFSESFATTDCDCAQQLHASLARITAQGGFCIYEFAEGRGAGLAAKFEAIQLQSQEGLNTRQAYERLGLSPDPRDFSPIVQLCEMAGIPRRVALATNNPGKIRAFEAAGFTVERVVLQLEITPTIASYLQQKRECLGHLDS